MKPTMRLRPISTAQQPDEDKYEADCLKAEESLRRRRDMFPKAMLGQDLMYALHKAGLLPQWPIVLSVTIEAKADHLVSMTIQVPVSHELVTLLDELRPEDAEEVADDSGTTGDDRAGG